MVLHAVTSGSTARQHTVSWRSCCSFRQIFVYFVGCPEATLPLKGMVLFSIHDFGWWQYSGSVFCWPDGKCTILFMYYFSLETFKWVREVIQRAVCKCLLMALSGIIGKARKPFFLVAMHLDWLNPIVKQHFLAQSINVHL